MVFFARMWLYDRIHIIKMLITRDLTRLLISPQHTNAQHQSKSLSHAVDLTQAHSYTQLHNTALHFCKANELLNKLFIVIQTGINMPERIVVSGDMMRGLMNQNL